MRADELRAISLFDGLADDQLAELAGGGTEVRIEPGVDLFLEGEHADFWWVLIDGAIDLLRHIGREDTVVGRMGVPGRGAGGCRAWDEHGVYLATRRRAAGGLGRPAGRGWPRAWAANEAARWWWLPRQGVPREWTLAPPLAAAGVDLAWCERVAAALAGSALEPGLEWVASTFSIATLLSEMKASTRRISALVAAIKSYSRMDRASLQQIDMTDGI